MEIYNEASEKIQDSFEDEIQSIKPISLVLLDFQMPRLNGIQVIEKIRYLILNLQKKNHKIRV